jgi:hypothetical protein
MKMNMKSVKVISIILMVIGAGMVLAGGSTYMMVANQLKAERITVSEDADRFGGQSVAGPFTAYQEALIIEKHALEATGGKTYAELDRTDPLRAVAMNGSFLRASLFTSVVAFGVSALVVASGLVFVLLGWALRRVSNGSLARV